MPAAEPGVGGEERGPGAEARERAGGGEARAAIAVGGSRQVGQCIRVVTGDGNSRSWVHWLDIIKQVPVFAVLLSTMLTEAESAVTDVTVWSA